MADFGLPEPVPDPRSEYEQATAELIPPPLDFATGEVLEITREERIARSDQLAGQLNAEQRAFVDELVAVCQQQQTEGESYRGKQCFYLSGDAGTGKTFTLNVAQEVLNSKGYPVRASATTGKAATHLDNGQTMHRLFGLTVGDPEQVTSTIRANSFKAGTLSQTAVFICDEISMCRSENIDAINKLLRDVHDDWRKGRPFGGHVMIFTGDIKQLLPVVKDESDPFASARVSFFKSKWYRSPGRPFHRVQLMQNMRQGEGSFREWIRGAGTGESVTRLNGAPCIRVPTSLAVYDEEEMVQRVFPSEVLFGDPMELLRRAIICPLNSDVDRINKRIVTELCTQRPWKVYLSAHESDYTLMDSQSQDYATGSLQYFRDPNLPDHELRLCQGMPVMCMTNLSVEEGVCNGTNMIVEELRENVVLCRIRNRYGRESVVPIHPVRFSYDERARGGRKFFRIQLPLRPAIAITVHRGQGGTYEVAGFHGLNIFESFGLTFVAISRCTSERGFTVLTHEPPPGELPLIRTYVHPMVIEEYAPRRTAPRHRQWDAENDETEETEHEPRVHGDEPVVVVDAEEVEHPEEREANAYGEYDSDAGSNHGSDDSFFI
jgi:ATP-dependent DNA helicase PIF1